MTTGLKGNVGVTHPVDESPDRPSLPGWLFIEKKTLMWYLFYTLSATLNLRVLIKARF